MISTAILGVTAFFLITGALLGFGRGAMRSVLRLITVGGSAALNRKKSIRGEKRGYPFGILLSLYRAR